MTSHHSSICCITRVFHSPPLENLINADKMCIPSHWKSLKEQTIKEWISQGEQIRGYDRSDPHI